MRERKLKKIRPVSLENFQAEFPAFEFLIKKREVLGCNGALPEKEREIIYRFGNMYHFLSEEAEKIICVQTKGREIEHIRQQADGDIALGVWRWYYNRRPIKISVETAVVIGVYFHINPGNDLLGKTLFIWEEVLGMSDKITPPIKALLLEKFPFLSEIHPVSQEKYAEWMKNIHKKYGHTQELSLRWL